MSTPNHINYVEFKANNINAVKAFYISAFGWTFTDYGPDYTSFSDSGLLGGFEFTDEEKITNGALIVIYHKSIKESRANVVSSGGRISKDIFDFPGGKRFHFLDPSGNEMAVWSDK